MVKRNIYWQKYVDKIYKRVHNYIIDNSDLTYAHNGRNPTIYVSDTCGSDTAGQVWCGSNDINIELSSWILVDKKQTQSVIRHELAHVIVYLCGLGGGNHGRGFTQALKLTAPKTFRRDRHWYDTSAIYRERKKHHPKTQLG